MAKPQQHLSEVGQLGIVQRFRRRAEPPHSRLRDSSIQIRVGPRQTSRELDEIVRKGQEEVGRKVLLGMSVRAGRGWRLVPKHVFPDPEPLVVGECSGPGDLGRLLLVDVL